MSQTILCSAVLASLILALPGASAAEDAAAAPNAKPDNFVSLRVEGCHDKCAEFEISIYDNGRLLFRPNNDKNSTGTPLSKNGMRSIYTRVSKYLQDTGALNEPAECTNSRPDAPHAIVESSQNGQVQSARWSTGC